MVFLVDLESQTPQIHHYCHHYHYIKKLIFHGFIFFLYVCRFESNKNEKYVSDMSILCGYVLIVFMCVIFLLFFACCFLSILLYCHNI